jgi:hypothetical protein
MTRALISVAVEDTAEGPLLVTIWEPTPEQYRAYYDLAPTLSVDPNLRLVVSEREPFSPEALALLFATYGERPVLVGVTWNHREERAPDAG